MPPRELCVRVIVIRIIQNATTILLSKCLSLTEERRKHIRVMNLQAYFVTEAILHYLCAFGVKFKNFKPSLLHLENITLMWWHTNSAVARLFLYFISQLQDEMRQCVIKKYTFTIFTLQCYDKINFAIQKINFKRNLEERVKNKNARF